VRHAQQRLAQHRRTRRRGRRRSRQGANSGAPAAQEPADGRAPGVPSPVVARGVVLAAGRFWRRGRPGRRRQGERPHRGVWPMPITSDEVALADSLCGSEPCRRRLWARGTPHSSRPEWLRERNATVLSSGPRKPHWPGLPACLRQRACRRSRSPVPRRPSPAPGRPSPGRRASRRRLHVNLDGFDLVYLVGRWADRGSLVNVQTSGKVRFIQTDSLCATRTGRRNTGKPASHRASRGRFGSGPPRPWPRP